MILCISSPQRWKKEAETAHGKSLVLANGRMSSYRKASWRNGGMKEGFYSFWLNSVDPRNLPKAYCSFERSNCTLTEKTYQTKSKTAFYFLLFWFCTKIRFPKSRTGVLNRARLFDIFLFAKLSVEGLCLPYLFPHSLLLSTGQSLDGLQIPCLLLCTFPRFF